MTKRPKSGAEALSPLSLSLSEEEEEKEGEEGVSSRLPSFEGGGKRGGTRINNGIFSVWKTSEQGSKGTLYALIVIQYKSFWVVFSKRTGQ